MKHPVFEVPDDIGRIVSRRLASQPFREVLDNHLARSLDVGLNFGDLVVVPPRLFSGHSGTQVGEIGRPPCEKAGITVLLTGFQLAEGIVLLPFHVFNRRKGDLGQVL
jgi:hypothetical protein